MPRDGSGVYSLPAGTEDFVANTTIESGKIDSLTADVKTDLNNLTNGTNFWTGQFKSSVGTAAAPGMTFVGDLDTGIYRAAADTIGFAAGGIGKLLMTTAALIPVTSDGMALGSSTLMWSDGFFASGAVLNFNNGNVTWTHSAGNMALGGSATDVVLDLSNAAAGQIKFPAAQNASADANTLDDYREGTFTGTLTGCTTSPTVTISYVKTGGQVVIGWVDNLLGTSNTTAATITGMPAAIRPVSTRFLNVRIRNNGVYAIGLASVDSLGVITLYSAPDGSAFTNSGSKGAGAGDYTYLMA